MLAKELRRALIVMVRRFAVNGRIDTLPNAIAPRLKARLMPDTTLHANHDKAAGRSLMTRLAAVGVSFMFTLPPKSKNELAES